MVKRLRFGDDNALGTTTGFERLCVSVGSEILGSQGCEAIRGSSGCRGRPHASVCGRTVVSSRIRSDFGLLGERLRRRPTHCIVDEVHPGIVLSWSGSSSGWVALVAYGDESGVLHVGPLPAARLRPV